MPDVVNVVSLLRVNPVSRCSEPPRLQYTPLRWRYEDPWPRPDGADTAAGESRPVGSRRPVCDDGGNVPPSLHAARRGQEPQSGGLRRERLKDGLTLVVDGTTLPLQQFVDATRYLSDDVHGQKLKAPPIQDRTRSARVTVRYPGAPPLSPEARAGDFSIRLSSSVTAERGQLRRVTWLSGGTATNEKFENSQSVVSSGLGDAQQMVTVLGHL